MPVVELLNYKRILEKAHSNPQGLFNLLLSPETIEKIPENLQQVLLLPLKTILSDSLHLVFLVAMCIAVLGVVVSLLRVRLTGTSSLSLISLMIS